jgi:hypothetical protein
MFCPECRAEYREGFLRCSDCDIPLVDQLVTDVVTVDERVNPLRRSREARFAVGYSLYAIAVGGPILLLGVVGLQAADSFNQWLFWEVVAAGLLPGPMLFTGWMLRVKPHWGRRIAFTMALITLVCAALFIEMPRHPPKSRIDEVFGPIIYFQAMNFLGAAFLGLLLGWHDLRRAVLHRIRRS